MASGAGAVSGNTRGSLLLVWRNPNFSLHLPYHHHLMETAVRVCITYVDTERPFTHCYIKPPPWRIQLSSRVIAGLFGPLEEIVCVCTFCNITINLKKYYNTIGARKIMTVSTAKCLKTITDIRGR